MEGRLFFHPKFRTKSRNFPALESLMKQKKWSGRGGGGGGGGQGGCE